MAAAERIVELPYAPRRIFIPYHERRERWASLVAHRRAGKTVGCVNDIIARALSLLIPHGRYAYVAPFLAQAKEVAWEYLKRFSEPASRGKNESELWVELVNGSRIRIHGADNPDRLRGAYLDGVVLDEYADMRPSVWGEVIRPMLADRQGWATFIGTPKGRNEFYDVHKRAVESPDWFAATLKASETGILSSVELTAARGDMTEAQYAQEFECSFEAAIQGAYFAKEIADARAQRRIGNVARDPLLPVRAFLDLGGAGATADAMAIWVGQFVGREIRLLHYIEGVGQVLAYYVNKLRELGYADAMIVLPHDGVTVNSVTGKHYYDHWKDAGFNVLPPIANQGRGAAMMRVEAARRIFPQCWFNEATCEAGIDALIYYHERWDEERKIGLGPEHDWSSHGADAFGLMAIAYEAPTETQPRKRPRRGSWMGA
jgi:hypothetical protein